MNAVVLAAFAAIAVRAVEEPRNDFRFAILGDRTGGAQPQVYGRVWREIDLMHPEFVINVGDTIQGREDATAEQQWRELRPNLGALPSLSALHCARQSRRLVGFLEAALRERVEPQILLQFQL